MYQDNNPVKSILKFLAANILFAYMLIGGDSKIYAQFNACQDTINKNYVYCYPPNDTLYQPVCGCDQKTYTNICHFQQAHLLNYTPGPCEEIAIPHIYPNPCSTILNYRIYTKQAESAFVYIYDEYGRPRYYHYFQGVQDVSTTIDVNQLPTGGYILIAVANGHFASKKFIKY